MGLIDCGMANEAQGITHRQYFIFFVALILLYLFMLFIVSFSLVYYLHYYL